MQHVEQRELEAVPDPRDLLERERRLVELPVGESGHLQVRGPNQTLGYFKRPDVYLASSTADGWFDTGDLAYMTADGYIRISGRSKDVIRNVVHRAKENPKRVVFPEGDHPLILQAVSQMVDEGICVPILLNRRAVGAIGVDLRFDAERDYERYVKFLGIVASSIAQAVKVQRLVEEDKKRLSGKGWQGELLID